ncbi:UDP-glucose--hexose-1-phosphate uridylyltransferase [Treponema sp.]|uniref:UDP-glucose--hexose-1-phosphate uridylyltransferase n=1 Tax=Treponema sp. TaxID=166 RepID=UPI00388D2250
MTIYESINSLVGYGLVTGLISEDDVSYTQNRLLEVLELEGFEDGFDFSFIPEVKVDDLESILKSILDWACEKGLCENSVVYRDLFDTKLMGCLVDRPSSIRAKYTTLYEKSPKEATDWYYKFSQDTDYIRRYRVCKDVKWQSKTEYGDMDITINLSKPEKDPKAIAAALNAKKSGYPACLLCKENEGYSGRVNHPARQTHRIIPFELCGEKFGLQYSPYVYYNEHCIVFAMDHVPMAITNRTWRYLLDFVKIFPHYTIGSNADLPIVGGSILTHNHFQGGNYEFAMTRAPVEKEFIIAGFEDVKCGIVKWPMSVLRLKGIDPERIALLADRIHEKWRGYTDEDAFIFAETDGVKHNTLNPIARRRGELFELDLVLRNNITTEEHPLGVYHPHAELHHIKKENIGLIEVMGLAILPGRLKTELADLGKAIVEGRNISTDEILSKHADWVKEFLPKYKDVNASNIEKIIRDEVGLVFSRVLEDAGVYKRNEEGKKAFEKFMKSL